MGGGASAAALELAPDFEAELPDLEEDVLFAAAPDLEEDVLFAAAPDLEEDVLFAAAPDLDAELPDLEEDDDAPAPPFAAAVAAGLGAPLPPLEVAAEAAEAAAAAPPPPPFRWRMVLCPPPPPPRLSRSWKSALFFCTLFRCGTPWRSAAQRWKRSIASVLCSSVISRKPSSSPNCSGHGRQHPLNAGDWRIAEIVNRWNG
jgi:hypothetical protein